jgi:hypothetical protein
MTEGEQTKAERRAARGGGAGGGKARKRAEGAERPKSKRRKSGGRRKGATAAAAGSPPEEASFEERLDWRLTRIEEAVAAQSKVSEELLERVNAILAESPDTDAPDETG